MKKNILTVVLLLCASGAYASPVDILTGVGMLNSTVTNAVMTKNINNNSNKMTDAIVRNIDAQTETAKNSKGIKVVRQADGTAKVYQNGVEVTTNADPNSAEYKMGLKMAENMANYFERKEAKAKLKQIKAVAKIEKDTKTLELIKKYKKAGPIVTLEKLEETQKNN